ncbi:hypothetical protein CHLNCDRAFT_139980 [Chlorella variabilis]|uniref:Cysteine proteinase inhibitor n=1 Tax=Chlorella variabilis TaxID=554065 RepID=E1ZRB3_CHLVA|nr:hypothetical protein CHLNCDRAFT_139980 [Chlorella variabilis]EFN51539.1 hypothetical protein CHLNCDRAFT_139980 [Chlorella variabilis]|eukprot:XP_005843641.1 hypothetical protein CHLNCDRAFT_139980 [Chlorella variabilis]
MLPLVKLVLISLSVVAFGAFAWPVANGTGTMLGGFRQVDDSANSAAVEAAKGVAVAKLGVPADAVKVLAAETQVVAGTNYKLKLRVEGGGGTKYYEAKIWEKLPAYGGAMELTSLEEISAAQAGGAAAAAADEFPDNPEVDEVAAYAVLSAKVQRGAAGGVTHHLKLQLSHGTMPDQVYQVEVANPGGSYVLQNSQQLKAE